MPNFPTRPLILLTTIASLSACSTAPHDAPTPKVDTAWQAALPHGGTSGNLLHWWGQFNDKPLLALLESAENNNPSIAQAIANIDQARANADANRGGRVPNVSGSASGTLSNGTDGSSIHRTTGTAGLDASWEIDLWGGVKSGQTVADLQTDARQLDWHAARTSVAAEVATTYVSYRACEALHNAYINDVQSRTETARLTRLLVREGFTAPADGALADASAATGRQQEVATGAECDVSIKSLVALTGISETQLRTQLKSTPTNQPMATPFNLTALPAAIISQRPDVAAAEKNLAAADAQINVTHANRLPRLSLLGSISFFGIRLSGANNTTTGNSWSFGPSLSLPIFDAGTKSARERAAKAAYASSLATYRQTVSTAVREVETALVNVDAAQRRLTDATTAKQKYNYYFAASIERQKYGSNSLIELEDARRTNLSAEQNLINLKRELTTQQISLYKAIGGGWNEIH